MIMNRDATPPMSRILIVDDERDNRELLEIILTHEGFVLATAATGEEALAKLALDPADLVLLDIMMPGMDGYQVAAKIKGNAATKDIPVIMISALDGRDARMRARSVGADDFVAKPVERVDLCVRMRRLLELRTHAL